MWKRSLKVAWGLGLVAVVGCEGASGGEACATYACVNTVSLTGSVEIAQKPNSVDATYCVQDACQHVTIEVAKSSLNACAAGIDDVCVELNGDQLKLLARWQYQESGDDAKVRGVAHSVKLVDHESGEVLLDETRNAEPMVTREDNCHRCWSSELSF